MDTSLYTNLKRTTEEYATGNGSSNGHIQTNQATHCPEPVHFLNLPSSPTHITTTTVDESSMIGTYQSNYTFSTNDLNHDVSAPDYGNNVNAHPINTNNSAIHLNGLNNTTTGTHQRRGSLQLWQFLVALLDEPESR